MFMEIKPNLTPSAASGAVPVGARSAAKQTGPSADSAVFGAAVSIDARLRQEPASRPDAVRRAIELINDPGWPSAAVQRGVAGVLAAHGEKLTFDPGVEL